MSFHLRTTVANNGYLQKVTVNNAGHFPIYARKIEPYPVLVDKIKPSNKVRTDVNTIFVKQKAPRIDKTAFISGSSNYLIDSNVISHFEKFLTAEKNIISTTGSKDIHSYNYIEMTSEKNKLSLSSRHATMHRLKQRHVRDFDNSLVSDISTQSISEIKYVEY